MNTHGDLKSDKTIILGFTGPIGSGCSNLSKFIANDAKFHQLFKDLGFTDEVDEGKIKSNVLDDEVIKLFKKKQKFEKKIDRFKNETQNDMSNIESQENLSNSKTIARAIHQKTKSLLEQRNYINSLEYLLNKDFYKDKLRISCSSIIVFELIRQLPDESEHSLHSDFIDILNNSLQTHNVDRKIFINIYDKIISLHEHEYSIKDIPKNSVPYCFMKIKAVKKDLSTQVLYRTSMQDFGDNLRSTGNPYEILTTEWINAHKSEFQRNNNVIGRYIDYLVHYYSLAKNTRFFLIDSLRNPMTIKYLRKRYPRFFLISLYSPYNQRLNRVQNLLGDEFNEEDFKSQDRRDQGNNKKQIYDGFYKQNVREAVLMSDIAVNNEDEFSYGLSGGTLKRHESSIFLKLLRYLSLVVDPGCTKPTAEEMFMNMAYTMAMKSNCISRKVGAIIEGANGYVIGAGWNDVGEGQISCGLRNIKDLRMEEYAPYIDAINSKKGKNSLSPEQIIDELIQVYGNENCCFCLKDELSKAEVVSRISKIHTENDEQKKILENLSGKMKIKRLEFCKALHAEENAILQSAKIGGLGLKDSRIYVTTHPCELCAKKIQQAGMSEIIYVEPYPKSLSKDLFLSDGVRKVDIRQFEGVKAHSYIALFQPTIDRKERQQFCLEEFNEKMV